MAGESFNFWNGKSAEGLEGLAEILKDMSYEEFSSYVNESKNDFANWIEGSLENRDLAEKIRPLLEKDLIRAVIDDFLSKQQNKLIIGVGSAVQEDSLVKEVMRKNEDFFKQAEKEDVEHEKSEEKHSHKDEDFKLRRDTDKNENKADEKGSRITFMDIPKMKASMKSPSKHDFLIGIIFGIVIGILLTMIVQQLILSW